MIQTLGCLPSSVLRRLISPRRRARVNIFHCNNFRSAVSHCCGYQNFWPFGRFAPRTFCASLKIADDGKDERTAKKRDAKDGVDFAVVLGRLKTRDLTSRDLFQCSSICSLSFFCYYECYTNCRYQFVLIVLSWSHVVRSRDVHPCYMVSRCPVSRFQRPLVFFTQGRLSPFARTMQPPPRTLATNVQPSTSTWTRTTLTSSLVKCCTPQ